MKRLLFLVCTFLGSISSSADATGTISGAVKDGGSGAPLGNAQVTFIQGGAVTGSTVTDASGAYSASVDAGTYYVRADVNDYLSALHPDALCYGTNGCDLASAQQVSVADGANVANIDLALSAGGSISGTVRDDLNQPIGAGVTLYDGYGNQYATGYADNFGHYKFSTLPPGGYKMVAQAGAAQMYKLVTCDGPLHQNCDLSKATALTISGTDGFVGIDFALPRQASVEGTVATEDAGSLYYAQVNVLDANGNLWEWTSPDSSGHYVARSLAVGTYYVYVTNTNYFSQIFGNIDCAFDCTQYLNSATPVVISEDGQQVSADFLLHKLPLVQGHIQDAVSGLPLANVQIAASASPPAAVFWPPASAYTDASGNYAMLVPAGTYYLWATSSDHLDQVYAGVPCELEYDSIPDCDVVGATLLTVAPGQALGTFDFALPPTSSIEGRAIVRAGTGSDLPAYTTVSVFDAAGTVVGQAFTDASGNYMVADLPAGTYFAGATDAGGVGSGNYVQQFWQQIDCPSACPPTNATPIVLAQGLTAGDIDFVLTSRNSVVGRVTNALGTPISGALVDLFSSTDGSYKASGIADAQGYYAAIAQSGASYFVATEAGNSYYDQVYVGISCPLGPAYYGLCPFDNATAVSLTAGSTQPHTVDFMLQSNDPIFKDDFE